jgi:D-3-phosphoglycerate dehydrogenase
MPRVIVLDKLSTDGLNLLKSSGVEFEVRTGLSGDPLRSALAEFDGAICRSGVQITAESLEGNKRLRAIVRAGVGTDNIDKTAATRHGIVVMNTPAGNTISTAEHTIALLMALSRNVAPAYQSLIDGRWDRSKFMGTQLAGKTLGIIGLGRIGRAVAARAKALEMKVLGYDPFLSRDKTSELGIEPAGSVKELLPVVDFLTVHTPLTDETRHMISLEDLPLLRQGIRLINCARGGIYDEQALVKGLQSGQIAGVALDVFDQEPCTKSPLFGMSGVLCTPHLGASTEEAQANVALEAVQLLVDFLLTGSVRHAVNMSPLDAATLAALRGYLDVAYRLGILAAQLTPSGMKSCRLQYRGTVAEKDTKLLTASFAAGLLSVALEEYPNIVNAELLLQERGIEIQETQSRDTGAFSSVISAELITDSRSRRVAGTLFGNNMPRLVHIDEHRLEAYLDGVLLIFTHRDVPGIIGHVGTIFGKHKINIAQMAVGRHQPGGEAIGVLNLDHEPSSAALHDVLASPDIQTAQVIKLPAAGELPSWLR